MAKSCEGNLCKKMKMEALQRPAFTVFEMQMETVPQHTECKVGVISLTACEEFVSP